MSKAHAIILFIGLAIIVFALSMLDSSSFIVVSCMTGIVVLLSLAVVSFIQTQGRDVSNE